MRLVHLSHPMLLIRSSFGYGFADSEEANIPSMKAAAVVKAPPSLIIPIRYIEYAYACDELVYLQ